MSNPTDPLETDREVTRIIRAHTALGGAGETVGQAIYLCAHMTAREELLAPVRVAMHNPEATTADLASELARVRAELEMSQRETVRHRDAQFSADREVGRLMDELTLAQSRIVGYEAEIGYQRERLEATRAELETAKVRISNQDTLLVNKRANLDATKSLLAASHAEARELRESARSLIATIDRDGGQRQQGETVAQSCERAAKVVVQLSAEMDRYRDAKRSAEQRIASLMDDLEQFGAHRR